MANYYGKGRTNYFRVNDEAAFIQAMNNLPGLEVHQDNDGRFMVMDSNPDGGGWPTHSYDEKTGEDKEINIAMEISKHLSENEVAVIMETGSEKHRYLIGWAVAINSKGEQRHISLNDIYKMASELGSNVTEATY